MMERVWKKEAVTDVVNVVLGAFLFLTPWFYGYVFEAAASWNAWLSGIAIAGLAIAALAAYAAWEEWLNLVVGLWVAVSPWLVGFHANSVATHLHVVVGVIVAVVAAARLWFAHHHTPHVTA
jgi:SPW repeat